MSVADLRAPCRMMRRTAGTGMKAGMPALYFSCPRTPWRVQASAKTAAASPAPAPPPATTAVKPAKTASRAVKLIHLVTESSIMQGLQPKPRFVVSHSVVGLGIPLLMALIFSRMVRQLVRSAQLNGLLPAVERPAIATVVVMASIRMLRNAAWILDGYVHTFQPHWHTAVDFIVEGVCHTLVPLDRLLVKVNSIVVVAFVTTVFVKWKNIFIERLIIEQQRRARQQAGKTGDATSLEDLERLLLPLDTVSSWLSYLAAALLCAQIAGINTTPLLAVGGASSIFVGLATQQLLTNATMGLSIFIARPFVAGDTITAQGAGSVISGVVERVTPMRTTFRTEDDVMVSIPNKTVADMIIYNKSANLTRSRLAHANRQTEPLKLRIKVPHSAAGAGQQLQQLQEAVLQVLSGSAATFSAAANVFIGFTTAAAAEAAAHPAASTSFDSSDVAAAAAAAGRGSALLVQPGSIEMCLSKISETGLELLVKAQLTGDPSNPAVRAMLLELNDRVRQAGATLVTL